METIKDFDLLIPNKRMAILAGREFDVSKISTRLALEQSEFQDSRLIMGEREATSKAISIVAKICGKPVVKGNIFKRIFNRAIDEKWLINNTNYEQLVAFINFVLEPLTGKADQAETLQKKKLNQE